MSPRIKKQKKDIKKSKKPFGPRVADIFLGESLGEAPAVVKIPRDVVSRKSIKKEKHFIIEQNIEEPAVLKIKPEPTKEVTKEKLSNKIEGRLLDELTAPFDAERTDYDNEIVFHFSGVAEIPEPIEERLVRDELTRFMEEDLKRESEIFNKNKKDSASLADKIENVDRDKNKNKAIFLTEQEIGNPIRSQVVKKRQNEENGGGRKNKNGDDLLKKMMQSDAVEQIVPWVAPPVSWNNFRKNNTKKVVGGATKDLSRSYSKKKVNQTRLESEENNKESERESGKKNKESHVKEAARIAVAVVVVGLIVGFFGFLGKMPRLVQGIEVAANEGATHLTAGLRAVAGSDVEAGKNEFDLATQSFTVAEEKLNSSTNIAIRLVAKLDPKERLASGENLLSVGKRLSALGIDFAALKKIFQNNYPARSLTEVLSESKPLITKISGELNSIDSKLKDINTKILPEDKQKELLVLQSGVHFLAQFASSYLDSQEVILTLLGSREDRQYLFIFENNRELRPGGGFIGSFALVNMSKGAVKKMKVDTIYNPDGQLREQIAPPTPLKKITDRWFTRDANWFADFRINARKVASFFEKSGGPTVDGVVAITPSVLQELLRVTGPIEMPEYKVTVTAENVIDETQRLVTFEYDKESNNPKAFISDLLPEVMDRAAKMSQERWADLVNVFGDSLKEKQILIWFRDQDAQERLEKLGWGGVVENVEVDYLMRVEANIGGHKTDELIEQSVKYDVSFDNDGSAIATLVTTRHHNGSKNGRKDWDPNEDWYRKTNIIYERTLVPKGSVLLQATGFTKNSDVPTPFENKADYKNFVQDADILELEKNSVVDDSGTIVSEESEKTSFGNWVITQPGETTVTTYRYRLPLKTKFYGFGEEPFSYQLLTQKQPGHNPYKFEATVQIPADLRFVWVEPENGISFENKQKATFTTIQKTDTVWGVVIDKK